MQEIGRCSSNNLPVEAKKHCLEVLSHLKENPNPNRLDHVINKPYIKSELKEILDSQTFHKLNWRINIAEGDVMFNHL